MEAMRTEVQLGLGEVNVSRRVSPAPGWKVGVAAIAALLSSVAGAQEPQASPIAPVSRNYKDIQAFMQQIVSQNKGRAELFDLGKSGTGETIQGVKIGDGPTSTLVVSTHHGNEYGSTETAKAILADLAANPIAGQTTYVIPVLNISGYNARSRYELNQDPNRDYPGPCGSDGPFALKSTNLLAQFIADKGIVTSATLHTFQPAVVYPWGISTHDLSTPYDAFFKQLVEAATVESHYETGNNTELIYPADGTFEDYAFWKHGVWSILFELGYSHNPSNSDVADLQRVNVPGMRRMLAMSPTQRAEKHDFTGRCDTRLRSLDRRDE